MKWNKNTKSQRVIVQVSDSNVFTVVHRYDDKYAYDFRGNRYCVSGWKLATDEEVINKFINIKD